MKLITILSAFVFVAVSATAAYAADSEKAPATEVKAEQPAKAAKPHSHVQDKTGVPQTAPVAAAPGKKNAAQDKSKHYHPRDMK